MSSHRSFQSMMILFFVAEQQQQQQQQQQQHFVSLTPATTFPLAQSGNATSTFRQTSKQAAFVSGIVENRQLLYVVQFQNRQLLMRYSYSSEQAAFVCDILQFRIGSFCTYVVQFKIDSFCIVYSIVQNMQLLYAVLFKQTASVCGIV